MNFYSHFYFDHQKDNPHYNVGLVLPDFTGMIDRRWKPRYHLNGQELSVSELNLYRGIQQHYERDRIFHQIPFFENLTLSISDFLKEKGFEKLNLRLFFAAHVILELVLDRYLLKLSDELPDTFYTCTTKAEHFDFESFFKSTGNKIHPKFYDFLSRFNEHKYLYSYKEDASITYALNRTFSRVRQENIPQEMEKDFYEVIHFTEEEINLNFDSLLESI